MKRVNLFLIFGWIICHTSITSAQNNNPQSNYDYTPVSPTSSSIATYVDYPIDYSTGVPNISIPLFDIDTKMGKIPFTLSYHVGKVKASEFTGPVGLGWTLTPDLGITTSVHGLRDYTGYFPGSNFSYTNDCVSLAQIAQGGSDYQPDDFYYSLLNKSGKFLYNADNEFSTIPYEPVKIKRLDINHFQITDTDGTVYDFGKDDNGNPIIETTNFTETNSWKLTKMTNYNGSDKIEFDYYAPIGHTILSFVNQYKIITEQINSYNVLEDLSASIQESMHIYSSQCNNNTVSIGWKYLKPDIATSPPNDEQEFAQIGPYSSSNGNKPRLIDYCEEVYDNSLNPPAPADPLVNGGDPQANPNSEPLDDPNVLKQNEIEERLLKEIRFADGKVTFVYDSDNRLSKLTLYQKTNSSNYTLQKQVRFSYGNLTSSSSYGNFSNIVNGVERNRYTLDNVAFYDKENININEYDLEYSGNSARTIPLAMGLGSDIWGFPYDPGYPSFPEMNYRIKARGGNSQGDGYVYMNVELGWQKFKVFDGFNMDFSMPPLLKKITYPTGGTREFVFERNRFKRYLTNDILVAGGFRIKKITDKANGSSVKSKVYKYGIGENGYGEVKYFPNKSDFVNFTVTNDASDTDRVIATVNSTPFTNQYFSGGAAVLYPEVREYTAILDQNDSIVDFNGYSKYEYLIGGLNNVRVPYTTLQYNYRDEWNRSSLERMIVYNNSNNAVREEDYDYYTAYIDTIPVLEAYQRYFPYTETPYNLCNPDLNRYNDIMGSRANVDHLRYDIHTGIKLLYRKVTTDNFNEISVIDTTEYDYNDHFMTSTIEKKNSRKKTILSEMKYPFDYSGNSVLNTMVDQNIVGKVIENKTYEEGSLLNTSETTYKNWPNGILAPEFVKNRKGLLSYVTAVEFDSYDGHGNPLEVSKADGPHTCYIWGYNGQYPVAKIENAEASDVASALGGGSLSDYGEDNLDDIDGLRGDPVFNNAMITTYTYEPLVGVTSITDPRGQTTTYEYDGFGRLEAVRDAEGKLLSENKYHYAGQGQ